EQRLRAEQQQSIASMREELMTQLRAEFSRGIPGQSNQQQFQQQPFQQQPFQQQQQPFQQQYQRPNQSQRQQNSNHFNYMTGVNYAVQQIQSVGRNSQSSYQPVSLHEDPAEEEGYRPGAGDAWRLGNSRFYIIHDSTSLNQGGRSPLAQSGGNSQGRGVGSSTEISMGSGRASAGRASVGRASAGRAIVGRGSGGRTSAGRKGRGNGQNA
ncbi:hypothetical protein L195_g052687, partial [Trifolium pratense]